jgi:hypothetical protein
MSLLSFGEKVRMRGLFSIRSTPHPYPLPILGERGSILDDGAFGERTLLFCTWFRLRAEC